MWWLLLPGALLVSMAVLAIGAVLSPKHPRHAAPRHLEAVPDPPGWGSMDLDAERTLAHPTVLLAAPVDPEPWARRLPTADERTELLAELSPEALDEAGYPARAGDFMVNTGDLLAALDDDPGAGDGGMSSPPPAPVPPSDWLDYQLADLFTWVRSVHAGALG